jgi:2-haloalkanoic acid dehalogenase type II
MRPIRAVLLDFGGTLYDYASLARAEAESLRALLEWVGIEVDRETLRQTQRDVSRPVFREYMTRPYYLHKDLFEDAMRAVVESLGGSADDALLARYRRLQWNGHARDLELRPGTLDTLEALRGRGLHVGMVSNIDNDQLEHMLDFTRLRPYFDSILSSESARSCKPDPAIFEQALEQAGCRPDQALFVGDSRSADIAGANRSGLHSVLLWHRDDRAVSDQDPRPSHVIRHLPELLELL